MTSDNTCIHCGSDGGLTTLHWDNKTFCCKGCQQVYQLPALGEIRQRAQSQLAMFHSGVKRFVNPHQYPVGLELGLHDLKTELILHARGEK